MITIVADESVDYKIILELRKNKFEVLSIIEMLGGIPDESVLNYAHENDSLLLTEDKDFGDLNFKNKIVNSGVLLLRFEKTPRNVKVEMTVNTIIIYNNQLKNCFSVLTKNNLRIKPLK